MRKVLIPIDGSDCALRGVALVIAKRALYLSPESLEIHLVNVQAPFSHDVSRFVSHNQVATFHHEESEQALSEARKLLDSAKVNYTCHYEVGNVAEIITSMATSLQCDQIVMGTYGRGALKEFLCGSITLKVVQLSPIPILLVK